MKILFLSHEGDSLGLAMKLAEEDHNVSMFTESSYSFDVGAGIISRIPSWRPELKHTDLVVSDSPQFGLREDLFKSFAIPTLGISLCGYGLTRSRFNQCSLLRKLNIRSPHFLWVSVDEAVDLNWNWATGGLYLKGNATVPVHSADLFQFILSRAGDIKEFLVQDIVTGFSVQLIAFHNGHSWLSPYLLSFNEYGLLQGTDSYYNHCVGSYVVPCWEKYGLYQKLEKLDPFLKQAAYRGPVAIDFIIDGESKPWALNMKLSLPFPAMDAFLGTLQEPLGKILFELSQGLSNKIEIGTDHCIAVGLSLPPWPVSSSRIMEGLPLGNIIPEQLRHISLQEIRKLESNSYAASGGNGQVMKVLARAQDPTEARKRVYRTIGNLDIPFAQYREDIGCRVEENLNTLREAKLI